jgi:hypothetical protein
MKPSRPRGRPPAQWREFPAALRALQRALDRLPNTSAIIGGVAVIAHGVTRFTEDIDATVAGARLNVTGLVKTLGRAHIVPRIPDWRDLVERAQVLLLVHAPTQIGIDLSLAWLPFEQEAMDRAETKDFAGATIRAVRPEDLLIYKLIAHRPQDLWDAERLLIFHQPAIDLRRVRSVLAALADHLDGPDRLASLDEICARLPSETKPDETARVSAPARRIRRVPGPAHRSPAKKKHRAVRQPKRR